MRTKTTAPIYKAALYCRLSRDDGKFVMESSSIQTQKEMLTRYAQENGIVNTTFYVDDGYSGTNFDRPDFQRMIEDIEAGKINMVLTKDLSRLGRDYIQTGIYTEIYFPEHKVRYIALNDTVDTDNIQTMDFAPLKNIMNEFYAKDTSRKVKTALLTRRQSGKFLSTSAPYGYRKSSEDKYKLEIDERYAPTVRLIFKMAKDGKGISQIRNYLNGQHILRPSAVNSAGYDRFYDGEDDPKRYEWSNNSVRGILRNPTYAGHLYTGKRPKPSFKSKKRLSALPEDYIIIPNVHEAIVSPEDYELVQTMITSRRNNTGREGKLENIFAGLIKCEDCGYALTLATAHRTKKDNILDNYGYMCNQYKTFGKSKCTSHWIEARDLYDAVLADIQRHAAMALADDEEFIEKLLGQVEQSKVGKYRAVGKELRTSKARLSDIDKLFVTLYEEHISGKISDRNYEMMSRKYEKEQAELEQKIADMSEVVRAEDEATDNAEQFTRLIREYAGIEELDAALLNTLIDKITVGEAKEVDGEKVREVKIYYKFIGFIAGREV